MAIQNVTERRQGKHTPALLIQRELVTHCKAGTGDSVVAWGPRGCYGGHTVFVSVESLKVLHPHAILELESGHQCGCVRFHTYKHDTLPIKRVALKDSGIIMLRDGVSVRMNSLPRLRTPENTRSVRRTCKSHKYFGGCSIITQIDKYLVYRGNSWIGKASELWRQIVKTDRDRTECLRAEGWNARLQNIVGATFA